VELVFNIAMLGVGILLFKAYGLYIWPLFNLRQALGIKDAVSKSFRCHGGAWQLAHHGIDFSHNSFLPGPCFGLVKFEPWFHSAISAGSRGVSPRRIRVLRASLGAAAAAARAAAPQDFVWRQGESRSVIQRAPHKFNF
jgi:hypothetical protein